MKRDFFSLISLPIITQCWSVWIWFLEQFVKIDSTKKTRLSRNTINKKSQILKITDVQSKLKIWLKYAISGKVFPHFESSVLSGKALLEIIKHVTWMCYKNKQFKIYSVYFDLVTFILFEDFWRIISKPAHYQIDLIAVGV